MNYVKKMCVLRQIKQGFSGDGKTLTGLIKVEQYGKNLAVEVSVINFAPLRAGEYYCILADPYGKTELLPLVGKCLFNLVSDLTIDRGFCGVICFVKDSLVPLAYGVNGQDYYDLPALIEGLSTLPKKNPATDSVAATFSTANQAPTPPPPTEEYNDERLASADYFERAHKETAQALQQGEYDERFDHYESTDHAPTKSADSQERESEGSDFGEDENDQDVLHPFALDGDGYYFSVKDELDALFEKYPRDDTLKEAFSSCEWVRLKGEAERPEYLVGVVYENLRAKYVCYAVRGRVNEPPEEIKDVCAFVPHSVFNEDEGFFVIFQSAATGECITPNLS
ncbi:MAG: hypothetical protein IJV80_03585 [Clostridia bacterium]|nr:hypothetical protein [Clostridia bacterium]